MADILPPAPVDAPFGSYNWADWYRKVRDAINDATSVAWNIITGTPTTVAGYGITDGVTLTDTQTLTNKTLTTPTLNSPTMVTPSIGAAIGTSLVLSSGLTTGATTLQTTTVDLTNAAGAAAGTLSNAPVAGNPTKWIEINDNGTIRRIPTW